MGVARSQKGGWHVSRAKKSLELSSGPHFTSRVWGGGVGLVRVRACVEATLTLVPALAFFLGAGFLRIRGLVRSDSEAQLDRPHVLENDFIFF